jgi:putative CocE/NonD family hydrolase
VLLMRTPYGKLHAQANTGYSHPSWYAAHGYVVAVQDCRGRWASDGEFVPFLNEAEDGYDAVEWAAGLPSSDGRVVMFGYSYPGLIQLLAATTQPPSLVGICPGFTSSQAYEGWSYRQGAFSLAWMAPWAIFLALDAARRAENTDALADLHGALLSIDNVLWQLPLADLDVLRRWPLADYFFDWLEHPSYDDYWSRWSVDERYPQITAPGLHFTGWYDAFLNGTVKNYVGLTQVGVARHRLVIFPWAHEPWTPVWGAEDSEEGFSAADDLHLEWLDQTLNRKQPPADGFPVRAYILHSGWHDFDGWPPSAATRTDYYLHSRGRANSSLGDGTLSCDRPSEERPDVYTYDPEVPTLSAGGHSCCDASSAPVGPACQAEAEATKSVLVYTSAPLDQDLWLVGDVTAIIFAASDGYDTDFVVRLCVVDHVGCSRNVQEGVVRASHRQPVTHPDPIPPGEVVEYSIVLGPVGIRVPQGFRLRVDLASSDFPQWDRNLNVRPGHALHPANTMRIATQTVHHDSRLCSRIVLPVLSASV